jgi:hypothetical protein
VRILPISLPLNYLSFSSKLSFWNVVDLKGFIKGFHYQFGGGKVVHKWEENFILMNFSEKRSINSNKNFDLLKLS